MKTKRKLEIALNIRGQTVTRNSAPTKEELVCCLMGQVGLSGAHISKNTGLGIRDVYSILKRNNIKIWDFRHGKSQWGKSVGVACVNKAKNGGLIA